MPLLYWIWSGRKIQSKKSKGWPELVLRISLDGVFLQYISDVAQHQWMNTLRCLLLIRMLRESVLDTKEKHKYLTNRKQPTTLVKSIGTLNLFADKQSMSDGFLCLTFKGLIFATAYNGIFRYRVAKFFIFLHVFVRFFVALTANKKNVSMCFRATNQ